MASDSLTFADLSAQRHHRQPWSVYDADGIVTLRPRTGLSRQPDEVIAQLAEEFEANLGGSVVGDVRVLNDKPTSRARDWHQDNHPTYHERTAPPRITVFVAYDDCPPGTLEYVPGSHRWPVVEHETLLAFLPAEQRGRGWQRYTEPIVAPAFRQELARQRDGRTERPALPKGTAVMFHPWLWHRSDDLERDALVLRCNLTSHLGLF